MFRYFLVTWILGVAVCLFTEQSWAQLEVIDEANLEQNTEIALDEDLNTTPNPGQAIYDIEGLEAQLRQWHSSIGPRPYSTRGMDYYYPDVANEFWLMTPGMTIVNPYIDNEASMLDETLNTHQSLLGMLMAAVGMDSDQTYNDTRGGVFEAITGADGILKATQAAGAASLFTADAVRRVEKTTAATANAVIVATAEEKQDRDWGLAILKTQLENTMAPTGKTGMVEYVDGGPGAVGSIEPLGGNCDQLGGC